MFQQNFRKENRQMAKDLVVFVLEQVQNVLFWCGDFKEIAIFDAIIKVVEEA